MTGLVMMDTRSGVNAASCLYRGFYDLTRKHVVVSFAPKPPRIHATPTGQTGLPAGKVRYPSALTRFAVLYLPDS